MADDRPHRREQLERREEVVADLRVRTHEQPFVGRQRGRLEQHAVRDPDLAHVVQQRAEADGLDLLLTEADLGREAHREPGEALGMAEHALFASFDRAGERARQCRGQQAFTEIPLAPARPVERLGQRQLELRVGERLRDEAVRAAGQRLAQVVAGGRAGDEDDRQVRPTDAHRLEQLESRAVGHEDVRDHELDALVREELQGLSRGRGADDLVARAGEHGGDHLADDGFVVDDEHLRHDASPASGSLRTNEAPVPTEETTLRSPPCARAISRLVASPRPGARLLRRERLEQMLADARIDAVAGVRDAREGPVAVALETEPSRCLPRAAPAAR